MRSDRDGSSLKAFLFRLIAILISFAIVAIFAEAALRIFTPSRLRYSVGERNFFCRFDRELGWAPLENLSGMQGIGEERFFVHQNQFGLRGPDDMQLKKTPGRKRRLILGDSYIWGFGVNQQNLFSTPEVHRTNDEIINFGVSGYGTDQEYLLLQRIWPDMRPELVVLIVCTDNDRVDNRTNIRYDGYRKPYFAPSPAGGLALEGQPVPYSLQVHIRENWLVRHLWLARTAVAAATVVFPTPPLPVNSKIRTWHLG